MTEEQLFKLVGKRIRQLRHERGLTQEEMSRRFRFNYKHYQRIEQGQQNLELATLNKLATAFEIPIAELLVFDSLRPKKGTARTKKPT